MKKLLSGLKGLVWWAQLNYLTCLLTRFWLELQEKS
jgi:hypothetical protein